MGSFMIACLCLVLFSASQEAREPKAPSKRTQVKASANKPLPSAPLKSPLQEMLPGQVRELLSRVQEDEAAACNRLGPVPPACTKARNTVQMLSQLLASKPPDQRPKGPAPKLYARKKKKHKKQNKLSKKKKKKKKSKKSKNTKKKTKRHPAKKDTTQTKNSRRDDEAPNPPQPQGKAPIPQQLGEPSLNGSQGEIPAAKQKRKRSSEETAENDDEASKQASAQSTEDRLVLSRLANIQRRKARQERKAAQDAAEHDRWTREEIRHAAEEAARSPAMRKAGRRRLQTVHRLSRTSADGIVRVDARAFKEYVVATPRPFWMLVLFTAVSEQGFCDVCHTLSTHITHLATAYNKHHTATLSTNGVPLQLESDDSFPSQSTTPPVFIIEARLLKNAEIFKALELETIPTVVLLPPSLVPQTTPIQQLIQDLPPQYVFSGLRPTTEPQDLADFIASHTGDRLVLQKSGLQWVVLVEVLLLVGLLGHVGNNWERLVRLRKRIDLFLAAAWVSYIFCISGGMYTLFSAAPFSAMSAAGRIEYIHWSPTEQYGAEGCVIGAVYMGCASMLVLVNLAVEAPKISRRPQNTLLAWASERLSAGLCMFTLALLWLRLAILFSTKDRTYHGGIAAGFLRLH